jgi:SpoVK/Ycf46/Vps4 family AAA+-type ATPase
MNEMLVQLNNAIDRGNLVIGATNYTGRIDPSVIRPGQNDRKIFIGLPDFEARIDAFSLKLKDCPCNIKKKDYPGNETVYYTFAEIGYIVDKARRVAKEARVLICSCNLNNHL